MINTRLVIALEELFKKEPFDLEIDTFIIHANRGIIYVTDLEGSEYMIDIDELYDGYRFY